MASIIEFIKNIRNARLGKDVRESIASAIEQTYEDASKDGNANMEVSEARGTFDTLNQRLNNSDNVKADRIELNNVNNTLQRQINGLSSGSPKAVTSISEMIDTSKIYVNVTDGKWYYYNGSEWVVGGNYQAPQDSNTIEKLTEKMNKLVEYTFGTYSNTDNLVFPLTLKNGDRLLIETTGNITVWTHSSESNLEDYDVERLGYVPANSINTIFNIQSDADYIRIYAAENGSFKATILGKKIEVIEKNILENSNNIEKNYNKIKEILDNFIIKHNLINTIKENSFYSCWVINEIPTLDSANDYACAIADVEGLEYISTNTSVDENFSCYADKDHKKISSVTSYIVEGSTNIYSVPQNAKYIYWTNHTEDWRTKGLVLISGTKVIDNPAVNIIEYPYGEVNYYVDNMKLENKSTLGQILNANFIPRIYHVEKDGSGDFDKLTEAINEAVLYKNSIVYLGDGEWDIIQEYDREIETMNQNKRGLYLKNGIHLICSSKSKIIANYTGSNNNVREWFSAFNSGEYGFTIENATIETSNIRYAIHDERDSDEDFYINKYINCNIKHTNGFYEQCIGGGLGLNGYIIIQGCNFKGNISSNPVYLVTYHNSADGAWDDSPSKGAKSFLDIFGNYFEDTGTIRLLNMGKSTQMTLALIHNNAVGAPISHVNNDILYYQVNIEMKNYCNELRT